MTVFDQFGCKFETELRKGDYKLQPNNPTRIDGRIHEFCPPEHVASEMDRLIEMHTRHVEKQLPPEVEGAWLHHAFTQIHPFQDGNGRVARALASLVFLKAGYFPLLINRDDRQKYIESLESADSGDLQPLVHLFCVVQKRLLTKAIGLAFDVRPAKDVSEAIEATRDLLLQLGRIAPKDQWVKAENQTHRLIMAAFDKLNKVCHQLNQEIGLVDKSFSFPVSSLGSHALKAILPLSKKLQYEPNFGTFSDSRALFLVRATQSAMIVVSFHGVGTSYRGLLAAVAFFQIGGLDSDNEPIPLSDDIFRIGYEESQEDSDVRFSAWLEACLVKGIGLWRRTLV